ncbi:BMC_2a_G0007160.mRNA.1.CDS.1 [Saccharomyces cerevisiae]|nr:Gle1p [Saccharomyces cerevisiae YJM1447]CAI4307919.1 BMB_G0007120.mRNA.1.CDS.1 [Saccharomyces cerevisiae]CAI4309733.1 BMC_2a_G0007160.mRNA.1.CDS.1 [Saccharomyces cerevisiae]CAI7060612.1 BMC_2a_G0007160.mRNA.1.CDS.1 [Saccharomyces cerevisiae]CAI7061531.1 BMB_G0007120.mRNA.1.CDS.1 [Saccharomyces cerevisiae]
MRFVFDEVFNSDTDSPEFEETCSTTSSTSSQCPTPEPSPAIKLPSFTKVGTKKLVNESVVILDPVLENALRDLNLQSKLIPINEPIVAASSIIVPHSTNMPLPRASHSSLLDNAKNSNATATLLEAIEESFQRKMQNLVLANQKEIQSIRENKRRVEEQRKRKEEEERKRKEAEEKAKREQELLRQKKDEEERKRKEAEAKLAQQKQEEERKKIEEQNEKERQLKKEHEAKLLQQKDKLGKAVTNFDKISKMFWHYKDKIAQIKQDIVLPIKKADVNVRNLLSRHKRKINPKFGQLTNSNQQLFKIQNELTQLINDTKGDSLAYHWILNFIAKAVVHQAETEVRVKPESALPLGKLTLYLLVQFPELQELFMARLVKKCPFVIGFTCEIDTEKGRQNMGWKRNNENKWEDNTSYDERMGGILSLFAIITRLQLPQEFITTTSHPFPIALSWHILARICNTPLNLITNTHFVILGSWWDAAAVQFLQAYGNQASKLLILIGEELTSRMAEKKYVGAARLRILLEAWQNNNMESFPEMSP